MVIGLCHSPVHHGAHRLLRQGDALNDGLAAPHIAVAVEFHGEGQAGTDGRPFVCGVVGQGVDAIRLLYLGVQIVLAIEHLHGGRVIRKQGLVGGRRVVRFGCDNNDYVVAVGEAFCLRLAVLHRCFQRAAAAPGDGAGGRF